MDLGCGPGFYTEALRAAGATVIPVDNDEDEMTMVGAAPEGALVADAGDLPLEDASVDGAFCSNLLEHTPDTRGRDRGDRAGAAPGRLGLHLLDELVLALGRPRHDPLSVSRARRGDRACTSAVMARRGKTPTARALGGARRAHDPACRVAPRTAYRERGAALLAAARVHLPGPPPARAVHVELRDSRDQDASERTGPLVSAEPQAVPPRPGSRRPRQPGSAGGCGRSRSRS